jgi:hypothetical protein
VVAPLFFFSAATASAPSAFAFRDAFRAAPFSG